MNRQANYCKLNEWLHKLQLKTIILQLFINALVHYEDTVVPDWTELAVQEMKTASRHFWCSHTTEVECDWQLWSHQRFVCQDIGCACYHWQPAGHHCWFCLKIYTTPVIHTVTRRIRYITVTCISWVDHVIDSASGGLHYAKLLFSEVSELLMKERKERKSIYIAILYSV